MSLKEATQDLHEKAEKNPFARLLLSGDISVEQYLNYLYNLMFIYQDIENIAGRMGIIKDITDIVRAPKIASDIKELKDSIDPDKIRMFPSTLQYMAYLSALEMERPKDILAHVYTRHFGDLYGGQIVKDFVPGSGTMYDFDDRKTLISKTRAMLYDGLAKEARIAFEYAILLFEDLTNEYNIQ